MLIVFLPPPPYFLIGETPRSLANSKEMIEIMDKKSSYFCFKITCCDIELTLFFFPFFFQGTQMKNIIFVQV